MSATLRAWSIRRYGKPDQLEPVERPMPAPGPTEILIRIHASAVTRADGMMRAGQPRFARAFLGLRRPRNNLSGTGLSGEVISIGTGVSRFAAGDAVFGEAGMRFGANATHICLDENGVLMKKPASLPHEDAAVMCDGPLTSLHFLQTVASLQAGKRVLILGGSGSLGSAGVQIAAAMGATVTATTSARNTGLVADLGAHHVIDYKQEEPLRGNAEYDVIFDTLGVTSFSHARNSLAQGGRYICPVLSLNLLGAMVQTSAFGSRKARFSAAGLQKPEYLRGLLEQLTDMSGNHTLAPVFDRIYPLDDLVAAHQHMETGHKRGNIVVV
ncbi:Zinc-type alcohol dehydrogenase-like protein (plasmid) [Pseudoseohaeicola sp. NH-UV-7]|uniref:NAD(P)-dependent alcohol dehydrogenase n=1 Tax=Sulfitobacter sp. TBRI5 TaxID=2989732 RepID=UPI003A774474